jgi:hypothetical protein
MPTDGERARLLEAIAAAADEVGLDAWYRSSVEPLMGLADRDMPRCCGGGCEPCSETLIEVAVRARRRLAAATEA